MVKKGIFREDIYYRINVVTVRLPPLRERRCDIPLLCDHFIGKFNVRYGKSISGISQEAMEMVLAHEFPGNIRELENVIEHAFVFCKAPIIEVQHLPPAMREHAGEEQRTGKCCRTSAVSTNWNGCILTRSLKKPAVISCSRPDGLVCTRRHYFGRFGNWVYRSIFRTVF